MKLKKTMKTKPLPNAEDNKGWWLGPETEKKIYCHEHCYTDRHVNYGKKKRRDNKL